MIKLNRVDKYFNKGKQNQIHVLDNISLELPERGMVAIFGKSGCGKTTMLNVIGGLDGFSGGSVSVGGKSIKKNTDVIRNKYIGYIFQNYNLKADESCFDNVADALRLCGMKNQEEIERRVGSALSAVDMSKYGKRPPSTLSGGQQQRIAIARAIVKNPAIILADEPTGNLDELNTVMIMDLLKAISRQRLVLLVTHEANLVDHYCDKVIELSDGKIASIRENSDANGFVARNKNDIWLGGLEKGGYSDEKLQIDFYGDKPSTPIKLTVVNNGGTLYLSVGSDRVQILDSSSEIKLKEGSYEEKPKPKTAELDMSSLPPIKGEKFGRLFTLKSSLKAGYEANFKNTRKKGKLFLQACMVLFAVVLVLMSAVFGTAFSSVLKASDSYNRNVFYVHTPDIRTYEKLAEGISDSSLGIDYSRLNGYNSYKEDYTLSVAPGTFETFQGSSNILNPTSVMKAKAVYLSEDMARQYKLLAGKGEKLGSYEMLISKKVADKLLSESPYGYIKDYGDLVGTSCTRDDYFGHNRPYTIAGVVDSRENAVYISSLDLARQTVAGSYGLNIMLASDYKIDVQSTSTVLLLDPETPREGFPQKGELVEIRGEQMMLADVIGQYESYDEFLADKGLKPQSEEEWLSAKAKELYPTLAEGSAELAEKLKELRNEKFYEYVFEEKLKYIDDYCKYYEDYELYGSFGMYLYRQCGISEAKVLAAKVNGFKQNELFAVLLYKTENGSYPTVQQTLLDDDGVREIINGWEELRYAYEEERYYVRKTLPYGSVYMLCDEDYIKAANRQGSSHKTVDSMTDGEGFYTVIHTRNYIKTSEWLRENFPNEDAQYDAVITPTDLIRGELIWQIAGIISSLAAIAVTFLLMSLCVYFIMRSSMMSRIKEVGIYRAIGVSKKNLVFKFFVEAAVLTALTVFLGFLVISAIVFAAIGASATLGGLLFYPLWYALAVWIVISSVTVFFGTLPVITLLRKTPSQILAKYDI